MDTEDFSFPKNGGTCAYSIDSPPLWNISPKDPSNPNQVPREGSKADEKDYFEAKVVSKGHKKSFSCVEDRKKITRLTDEAAPMDLLWEAFNEDLSSAVKFSSSSSREMVEFRCATTALTVVKTNKALLQTKNRPVISIYAPTIVHMQAAKRLLRHSTYLLLRPFCDSD
ncbi:hypothetical protein D0Y65_027739 [Glycine soja]|uniref:Uncharacterized protein n=1 Tax=Glycine soja TaxID=3848 RepID=A0A445IQQ7_GLYSO|nr:hypothetical protein D0Y65_027739 [Glycine soja]